MKRLAFIIAGTLMALIAFGVSFSELVSFYFNPQYCCRSNLTFERETDLALLFQTNSILFSPEVLVPVCHSVNLPQKWGQKYGGLDSILTLRDTCLILINRIGLLHTHAARPSAEIDLYADNPGEALELARATGAACRDWFKTNRQVDVIFESADQSERVIIARLLGNKRPFIFGLLFGSFGFVLIWYGRRFPRLKPLPSAPSHTISKY